MKRKNVFFKAGILLLSLLLLLGLEGCSSSKQGRVIYIRTYGTITSVDMAFLFEDLADGVVDNPIFTGGVTVETEDGTKLNAHWDETTPPETPTRVIVWTGGSKLDWQVERALSEDDELASINIIGIETDDGEILSALWDEERLGKPIVQSMGMTVEIKPTSTPDVWKVTKIVAMPQ